ncbi:MAG: methyltransferase domain-containing protein [Bacteroidales bacterium]|nr:methyltransferase domain-containing protein [Bacteroidales bacterium]
METKTHFCPVWVGYVMNSRFRKIQQNPFKILGSYVKPGMKILEIGPAMGFFSIPMAAMAAPDGKLFAVDIQRRMLEKLQENAKRKKLGEYIECIQSDMDSMNIGKLRGQIDFCLLANVVHEVPNQEKLFAEVAQTMKMGGHILFIEPAWHVSKDAWEQSLYYARKAGFEITAYPRLSGGRSCELTNFAGL